MYDDTNDTDDPFQPEPVWRPINPGWVGVGVFVALAVVILLSAWCGR